MRISDWSSDVCSSDLPALTVRACSDLVGPAGHVFFSTINRNLKSYLLAVIGAEYVLKLLPRGTHDYASFVKPSELDGLRSEARRVGKECVSTCISRWSAYS